MKGFQSAIELLNHAKSADFGMRDVVGQATKVVEDRATELAAVNTGAMQEGISSEVKVLQDGVIEGTVTAGAGLIYVEYGTGPRASQASKNGKPKNPEDISHRTSGWLIPLSALNAQQISDLENKYHYRKIVIKGKEYFATRGQAPQPFMYPAALLGEEFLRDEAPGIFGERLRNHMK